ncbi:MAG TPA: hypothetical protein VMW24_07520 [Sedimentisphaerales bacterium]|nr:hypothetical protein [Sedimentisphaerales bacterium]
MQINRRIILALAIAAIVAGAALPCSAEEKSKEEQSIWTDDGQKVPGPGWGPGRGRVELTDEEMNRIVESVKQRDAKQAKDLMKLREKDPEKFMDELRRHAREEYGQIVRERIETWREKRRAEFEEWLGKSFPGEAEELAKLKETDADLYGKKYDLAWQKYSRIFDESRRSPELAEVLIEDLKLQRRTEELLGKIKAARAEKEKKKLTAELEEIVGLRYDLIVRRKQIVYERLLKVLEDLQNRIKESHVELGKWQDSKTKAENVKQRIEYLLEGKKGFRWD